MQVTIKQVDYAPEELYGQLPIVVDRLRQMPGDDRSDYWLGELRVPLRWIFEGAERQVTHVVVGARWVGEVLQPGARDMPVSLAFVTDSSQLEDERLSTDKCRYVAIGVCNVKGVSTRQG